MIRNHSSNRSRKWFNRNNIQSDSCLEYVESLSKNIFDIDNIYLVYIENKTFLCVEYYKSKYYIFVNEKEVCLKVCKFLENNLTESSTVFTGDSCWYDCLNWITRRGK